MLSRVQSSDTNFKAARLNIVAVSDNHGNLMKLPRLTKTIENNAKDIFVRIKEHPKSSLNIFAIVGDWFINPSKRGFLTDPKKTNGDIQNDALLKFIESVKGAYQKTLDPKEGEATELDVLYQLGNHCLDGGDKFALDFMAKDPMKSLITNVNLERSPAVVAAMQEHGDKIVKSVEYAIQDDSNPSLFHKVLFVGATIPSMDFYNPGLCEGLEFYDNSNKKDANLEEADLQGTIKAIKAEVEAFKEKNPKGAVIFLSHMGGKLSEMVVKNVPQINHVLNGHDHKTTQSHYGSSTIDSLSQDNALVKSLNFEFDNDGNLVRTTTTPYFAATTVSDGLEVHPMQKFLDESFAKDTEPLIKLREMKSDVEPSERKAEINEYVEVVLEELGFTDPKEKVQKMKNPNFNEMVMNLAKAKFEEKESVAKGMTSLDYGDSIRYSNSYLMNYITSAIKRPVREMDKDVFTVALQSSIVRGGLSDGADNMKIMKIFDGVSEDLSNLKIGNVKGEELVGLIVENVLANLKNRSRNTIIHWSDVQVDRGLIRKIRDGVSDAKYSDAVKVRAEGSKEFIPIDLNKDYRMVIGEKFLVKDDIEWPAKIRDRFTSLYKTYDQLFKEYIKSVNYELYITPKTKETRIIDKEES